MRTFAQALYFHELAGVVGPEKDTSGDEQRCLGLFMLALWHASAPIPPEEMCRHRARATERKRKETEWMSDDGDTGHLCNFTALARGTSAALGLAGASAFTADDFRGVVIEFNATQGRHKGVTSVDLTKLDALLSSHGLTRDAFKAAMFTNVLTPERFADLQRSLQRTRQLKPRKSDASAGDAVGDDDDEGDEEGDAAAAAPKKAGGARKAAATPAVPPPAAARRSRRSRDATAAAPASAARDTAAAAVAMEEPAPMPPPLAPASSFEERLRQLAAPQAIVEAGLEEVHGIWPVPSGWLVPMSSALAATPSWEAAAPAAAAPAAPPPAPPPMDSAIEGVLLARTLSARTLLAHLDLLPGLSPAPSAGTGEPLCPVLSAGDAFTGLARAASAGADGAADDEAALAGAPAPRLVLLLLSSFLTALTPLTDSADRLRPPPTAVRARLMPMGTLVGVERSVSGLEPHAPPPHAALGAVAGSLGVDPTPLLAPLFDAERGVALSEDEVAMLNSLLQRTLSVRSSSSGGVPPP